MYKIDWEGIIIFLMLPTMLFVIMLFVIYMASPDAKLQHEKFKICIQSGMIWENNNCIEKKK